MMLVVVSKHLENNFTQRKPIFHCFEHLQLGRVPNTNDICVDGPNDVIYKITYQGHYVFKYYDYFEVKGLLRFDCLDN